MTTKVQKWGNSLAVRIPRVLAEETRLSPGASVEIRVAGGQLIIQARPKPRYRLNDLLRKVTKRNLHPETSTGGPVGREAV